MPATVVFRLAEILKEKGLRSTDLANLTGISKNSITKLTRPGITQVRLETIAVLCEKLDIAPADLFDYSLSGN